jgi:hypothetical protein
MFLFAYFTSFKGFCQCYSIPQRYTFYNQQPRFNKPVFNRKKQKNRLSTPAIFSNIPLPFLQLFQAEAIDKKQAFHSEKACLYSINYSIALFSAQQKPFLP